MEELYKNIGKILSLTTQEVDKLFKEIVNNNNLAVFTKTIEKAHNKGLRDNIAAQKLKEASTKKHIEKHKFV